MSSSRTRNKVVVFSCSWHAHSAVDAASKARPSHSPTVIPIRLSCIGRISTGLILKAYQEGAEGVCLLGCPDDECRYQTGNEQAQGVCQEAKELLALLGHNPDTLIYQQLPAGEGEGYLEIVESMLKVIAENQDRT